jgi:catechol 2,3-dioxygenase-like lactoylglutathione lyase family enzyme
MSWTIEKAIPTLPVPDLEVGIEFYSRLGFEVDWRWPEDEPSHAGLLLGSCAIMLSLTDPAERADVSACHAAVMVGRSWELAAAAGSTTKRPDYPPARSQQPPADPGPKGYGLRDFSIIDPWGHHLAFGQVISNSEI